MAEPMDWTKTTPEHMYGHVLAPEEFRARTRYDFAPPDPRLARWVERYWSVRWELGEDEIFPVVTLDEPSINLTLERGGVARAGTDGAGTWITGPVSRELFQVSLLGSGSVVGVKLRIGGAAAIVPSGRMPRDLRPLRDRTIPAADWFGADLPPADLPEDAVRAAGMLDAWLLEREPRDPDGYEDLLGILALLERSEISRLADLEDRAGIGARSLQRMFDRHVGIGPKRMLMRSRVMDAVAAIDRGDPRGIASLAQDLGWFDQSHFIRDFRAVTGRTPARYAAGTRDAARAVSGPASPATAAGGDTLEP